MLTILITAISGLLAGAAGYRYWNRPRYNEEPIVDPYWDNEEYVSAWKNRKTSHAMS